MSNQNRNNPILERCAECRRIGNLPLFPRFKLQHPLKDVLKRYRRSVRSLYESFPECPERPSLSSFYKMVNGEETMPAMLEIWLWRYFQARYGLWWIIVGESSGLDLRDHHFMTAEGWRLEKVKKYDAGGPS